MRLLYGSEESVPAHVGVRLVCGEGVRGDRRDEGGSGRKRAGVNRRRWSVGLLLLLFAGPVFGAGRAGASVSGANQAVLSVETGERGPEYRLVYPPEKVLKRESLPAGRAGNVLRLSLAAGEIEPFLAVLRPRGAQALLDVRFEWGALKGPRGAAMPQSALRYNRVAYHYLDRPSGWTVFDRDKPRFPDAGKPFAVLGRTGFFPDALVPARPREEAPLGENTQFWFECQAPRDARPGTYSTSLKLLTRGLRPVVVRLEVHVFNFALPAHSPLRNTACWSPQSWPQPLDEGTLRGVYREFARARQVPDPILPQPQLRITADGEVTVDTTRYEKMLAYCLDELHLPHFFFPRVGSAWYTNVYFLWHTPAVSKQRWNGRRIFTPGLEIAPGFQRVFTSYLRQVSERLRRRGWLKKALITSMDEPHTRDDFKAVRAYAAMVKAAVPELRRFCTAGPRVELEGAIDVWCPQQYDEEAVNARRAAGEAFMFYKNWLMLIDTPMVNPRLLGWMAWRTGAVGWLTYATMGRWRRAWEDPGAIYGNTGVRAWGLGLLFYPEPLRPNLLRSVRWEMMREGAEDWEYLNLLREKLAQLPTARRNSTTAVGARRFLTHATEGIILSPHVIPGGETDEWKSRPAYTTSNLTVMAARNEAARWIERLAAERDEAATQQGR